MVTGWYDDTDGNRYYLHTVSDGALGHMYTGWHWIDGNCYYFNEKSDGNRGALKRNTVASDGFMVNEKGQWIVDGVIQTKAQNEK